MTLVPVGGITVTWRALAAAIAAWSLVCCFLVPSEILASPGSSIGWPGVGMSSCWGSPPVGTNSMLPTLVWVRAWKPFASW